MFLTSAEADKIDAHVAAIESRTGVQIVSAVVGKSDTYVELPWKAFAMGASAAALAMVTADTIRPQWVMSDPAVLNAVAILGAGAACALLAIFVPGFARLFLRASRADLEVRTYARSMFLDRQVFATRARTGVLVLVSLFERRIEILADVGLAEHVAAADWAAIIQQMTPLLRGGRAFAAIEEALNRLEGLLAARGVRGDAGQKNTMSDRPIEERGA